MKKIFFVFSFCFLLGCSSVKFKEKWLTKEAPRTFKARFETTEGNFDILAVRSFSPKGVDRLYQLITRNYYVDVPIFRVVPNFVAQFGIHNDTLINTKWQENGIDDEPALQKNDSLTIAFARGGVNTRSNQIFINLKDNHRLDTLAYSGVTGFPVIAKVVKGKETIYNFYDGYGDKLGRKQDSIAKFGNAFLREKYPKVDYILKAYIIK